MANVTFTSPRMARDITVYAVAGDRGTLLALAKSHKIPIPFDCQDGECSSCLVEIKHQDRTVRYGIALTEKEKELLRQLGKITPQEIVDAEVSDMPPRYRLACQTFVRNEDILVSFEGDTTLPVQRLALSIAAPIYKGGLEMQTLDQFLSYAVKVEEDAAVHFDELAAAMRTHGNLDVALLFSQLAGYSRMHLAEARGRCVKYDLNVELPSSTAWPDNATPERTALWAGDAALTRLDALKAALQGERRGYEFYYAISIAAKDAEIRAVAKEFVREESEHVQALKNWIDQEEAALRSKAPKEKA